MRSFVLQKINGGTASLGKRSKSLNGIEGNSPADCSTILPTIAIIPEATPDGVQGKEGGRGKTILAQIPNALNGRRFPIHHNRIRVSPQDGRQGLVMNSTGTLWPANIGQATSYSYSQN